MPEPSYPDVGPTTDSIPLERVIDDDTTRREAIEWAVEALLADRSFDDVSASLAEGGWPNDEAAEIVEAARQQTRHHRGALTRDQVVVHANRRYRQAMMARWYVGMPMLAAAWRLMHSVAALVTLRRAKPPAPRKP